MNNIETIICLILLLMSVPDLCRKLGHPALANAFFVVFGLLLEPFIKKDVLTMVEQAGEVGFLLVLFEVGLEIDLPKLRELIPPLRFAVAWSLVQYPIVLGLAQVAGLTLPEGLLAAAALTGCSMSMAYWAWKHYAGLTGAARDFVVQTMIALEVLAIVVLSVESVGLTRGFGWLVVLRLAGMAVTVFLIGQFASHFVKLFQWIIEKTTRWRVHFLVLLVLIVCAVGQRLGLSAAKTAFFLGLFMSRAEFEGKNVEEYIAPISRRFLIPIFFVSLGLMVNAKMLFSYTALMALFGAFLILGFREMVHRRWLKSGGDAQTYLLFCPNLTVAALATTVLFDNDHRLAATWVILTGLFLSVAALVFQPRQKSKTAGKSAATTPEPEKEIAIAETNRNAI